MGRSTNYVCCLGIQMIVLASSIPFTLSQPSFTVNGDWIDQVCKQTPFYDLCSSTLHSKPLGPKLDLQAASLLMLKTILANATDTLSYIEGLIKDVSDRRLEQALAFCAESYIPIVKYILPQAADAINQRRFAFASYSFSSAVKNVNGCDKKSTALIRPLLGKRNSIVQNLVAVVTALIKLIPNT
ncbi:hypothetical protein VNO77_23758 [Canavalia gladiata]|uniref:Pectinesterase inhibitor domain-containing protein n=1 Tax=Canavalia gladiata TaxID=3824 RepID=A0AAN9LA89_CANGL